MEAYNFWQDFFDTYQSLSDGMKFAWLIVPPAFALGLIALILRYRIASKRADKVMRGELVYTVHRDEVDQLHVFLRGREIDRQPAALLFDQSKSDTAKQHKPNR